MPPAPVRADIKAHIDRLRHLAPEAPLHTTDSLAPASEPPSVPAPPAPFPAGNYRTVFRGPGSPAIAVWVNTETRLPHYTEVIPGKTVTHGTVQLSTDPHADAPNGPILNLPELDYLLEILYARFAANVDPAAADHLNRLKDMVIAVRFDGKPGVSARHRILVKKSKK